MAYSASYKNLVLTVYSVATSAVTTAFHTAHSRPLLFLRSELRASIETGQAVARCTPGSGDSWSHYWGQRDDHSHVEVHPAGVEIAQPLLRHCTILP